SARPRTAKSRNQGRTGGVPPILPSCHRPTSVTGGDRSGPDLAPGLGRVTPKLFRPLLLDFDLRAAHGVVDDFGVLSRLLGQGDLTDDMRGLADHRHLVGFGQLIAALLEGILAWSDRAVDGAPLHLAGPVTEIHLCFNWPLGDTGIDAHPAVLDSALAYLDLLLGLLEDVVMLLELAELQVAPCLSQLGHPSVYVDHMVTG